MTFVAQERFYGGAPAFPKNSQFFLVKLFCCLDKQKNDLNEGLKWVQKPIPTVNVG